jgi:hypothetical protein
MSATSTFLSAILCAVSQPTDGVVGVVDALLTHCRDLRVDLDWQGDRCRLRSAGGDWEPWLPIPMRKSGFRAMLARIAVLCNERHAGSVSPYGGAGEICLGEQCLQVAFTNTPDEQRLSVKAGSAHAPPAQSFGVPAYDEPHAGRA